MRHAKPEACQVLRTVPWSISDSYTILSHGWDQYCMQRGINILLRRGPWWDILPSIQTKLIQMECMGMKNPRFLRKCIKSWGYPFHMQYSANANTNNNACPYLSRYLSQWLVYRIQCSVGPFGAWCERCSAAAGARQRTICAEDAAPLMPCHWILDPRPLLHWIRSNLGIKHAVSKHLVGCDGDWIKGYYWSLFWLSIRVFSEVFREKGFWRS